MSKTHKEDLRTRTTTVVLASTSMRMCLLPEYLHYQQDSNSHTLQCMLLIIMSCENLHNAIFVQFIQMIQ